VKLNEIKKSSLSKMAAMVDKQPIVGVLAKCTYTWWHATLNDSHATTTVWINCPADKAHDLVKLINDDEIDVQDTIELISDRDVQGGILKDAKIMYKKPARQYFEINYDDLVNDMSNAKVLKD